MIFIELLVFIIKIINRTCSIDKLSVSRQVGMSVIPITDNFNELVMSISW